MRNSNFQIILVGGIYILSNRVSAVSKLYHNAHNPHFEVGTLLLKITTINSKLSNGNNDTPCSDHV